MSEQRTEPIKPAGRFFSLRLKVWIGFILIFTRCLWPVITGFINIHLRVFLRPSQPIFSKPERRH
ncbi:MAG: hypothetical protein IPO22_16130 [Anaerolineales bacterium]|nr:hypothetical protein [Anaerolineales bacterium]